MSIATSNTAQRPPSIEEIKARYTIADAWRDEGCPGEPGRSCKSPFRDDKHASFSVYDDGRKFKDHADDCGGDVLDFIAKARGCTPAEALAVARERIDTLERLLEAKGVVRRDEIEQFAPTADQAAERGLWMQEYLTRVLRIVQQEAEAVEANTAGDLYSEDVAVEVSRADA